MFVITQTYKVAGKPLYVTASIDVKVSLVERAARFRTILDALAVLDRAKERESGPEFVYRIEMLGDLIEEKPEHLKPHRQIKDGWH